MSSTSPRAMSSSTKRRPLGHYFFWSIPYCSTEYRSDPALTSNRIALPSPLRTRLSIPVLPPIEAESWFLDALVIALNERRPSQKWYVSIANLQLVSLQLCIACRAVTTFNVQVTTYTPRSLWMRSSRRQDGATVKDHAKDGMMCSRVPPVRAVSALWDLPECPNSLLEGTGASSTVWSTSLQKLTFGYSYNRALDDVELPSSLRELAFGRYFDQPIENVVWPDSLEQVVFGRHFNKDINNAEWPASLVRLSLGDSFNHPIGGVRWPAFLRQLNLGWKFNQDITDVHWPASLQQLSFGDHFNQPLDRVYWPESLRKLSLGWSFNHPLFNVWTWPDCLEVIVLAVNPRSYSHTLVGVRWPASLKKLTVCYGLALDPNMVPNRAEVTRLIPRNILLSQEA